MRSARDVHPDFVHDTFSAFYPLSAASPTIRAFGLEQHGLVWRHAPAVLGHPMPDGEWALLHRDRDGHRGPDGRPAPRRRGRLARAVRRVGPGRSAPRRRAAHPLPAGPGRARAAGRACAASAASPSSRPCSPRPPSSAAPASAVTTPRLLLAGNAAHADIPLDAPGSGLMGMLLAHAGPDGGLPGARGRRRRARPGARPPAGVAGRRDPLRRRGRRRRRRGRSGDRRRGWSAANGSTAAPRGGRRRGRADPLRTPRRRRGPARRGWRRACAPSSSTPATVKVDWALDGPVPWAEPPAYAPGTFHVADSVEQMTEALGAGRGRRGARPRRSCSPGR